MEEDVNVTTKRVLKGGELLGELYLQFGIEKVERSLERVLPKYQDFDFLQLFQLFDFDFSVVISELELL
jgi:hypothetical protein